ncbi:hypothetical protein F1D05_08175 [Kribbella qitaiheensis]|uniref:Uncharacterized protein n=1 Tax=Kribbella qitaiheensis TaxID=1544730 RepID=A0A7G6WV63_9ACTN|nr:hypothetical protein [Kribbella qitaiheensis]QNE17878.1 hypothetical protein F1D05_08175 [Kribbella qitaiheensis]
MTDHPGEQFPSEVDPDVEPGYEPEPDESAEPDYDSEPGAQSSYGLKPSQQGIPHSDPLLAGFTMYGELPPEQEEPPVADEDTEAAFEASLETDEPAAVEEQVEEIEEATPVVAVAPRPSLPSPASFQPRPPVPAPTPAPQARQAPQYAERDEDAPHPLVEETMARLDELRERPVGEHAEVYADLHERLQTALVEADAEDRR